MNLYEVILVALANVNQMYMSEFSLGYQTI